MTTIAAFVKDGVVAVGSDAMVTQYGSQWTEPGIKTVQFDVDGRGGPFRMVLGSSGSVRFADLVRHRLTPPHDDESDPRKYLSTGFADALRDVLTDAKAIDSKDGRDAADSYSLVAYRGRLFHLGMDFSVSEPSRGFDAVGSGHEVALGAMHALTTSVLDATAIVTAALVAASEIDPWTGGPLTLELVQ